MYIGGFCVDILIRRDRGRELSSTLEYVPVVVLCVGVVRFAIVP